MTLQELFAASVFGFPETKSKDQNQKMIEVRIDDVGFNESPDAGDPECRCSRCLGQIKENECPLRCLTKTKPVKEYRYCESCMEDMGFTIVKGNADEFWNDDPY